MSLTGLTPGAHGFHVHQFGDVRSTSDLSTMSAHFVPYCAPPSVDENGQKVGGCEADQKHGLPPSPQRQPGDMGNILVGVDGYATRFRSQDPWGAPPCALCIASALFLLKLR